MSFDIVPIWALFFGTIIFVIVSIEAGYRLGLYSHRQSADEKESPVSAIAGAVLGLVAFMLAFTFGIVYNRYDARKELVRQEAITIQTAWERSDFLPESDRAEAKSLIREYLEKRLAFVQARDVSPERVRAIAEESQRIHNRLWQMAVANARRDMNSDVAALYIESLNEVNQIRAIRVAVGLQARIPLAIWAVLYLTTMMGMMGMGYQTGIAGSLRSMARPMLAISFALVMVLIASLDRPHSDFISVSQQPQIDLLETMKTGAGVENELAP